MTLRVMATVQPRTRECASCRVDDMWVVALQSVHDAVTATVASAVASAVCCCGESGQVPADLWLCRPTSSDWASHTRHTVTHMRDNGSWAWVDGSHHNKRTDVSTACRCFGGIHNRRSVCHCATARCRRSSLRGSSLDP